MKVKKKKKLKPIEILPRKIKPLCKIGNKYFTDDTQSSILSYVATKDKKEREQLYINKIEPVFLHLIENVVFTFGYNNLADLDSLKNECLIALLSILDKFDENKISVRTKTTSKAFAYITVIAKNWFYQQAKKQEKIKKRNITFEDIYNHTQEDKYSDGRVNVKKDVQISHSLLEFNQGDENIEKQNFNTCFIKFLDDCSKNSDEKNMIKYINSIKDLIINSKNIDIFTKRYINFQIGEMTGLESSDIYICANKFKNKYKEFLTSWNNGVI